MRCWPQDAWTWYCNDREISRIRCSIDGRVALEVGRPVWGSTGNRSQDIDPKGIQARFIHSSFTNGSTSQFLNSSITCMFSSFWARMFWKLQRYVWAIRLLEKFMKAWSRTPWYINTYPLRAWKINMYSTQKQYTTMGQKSLRFRTIGNCVFQPS